MASVILKLNSAKQSDRLLSISLLEKKEDKAGYPGFLNEIVDGKQLPAHLIQAFVNTAGQNKWITISAALRKIDADGKYVLMSRKSANGDFLDEKGNVVADEAKAARVFEYLKDQSGNVVFGNIGVLNVKNTKSDKTPTAFTMISANFPTEANVLAAERELYRFKHAKTDEEKSVANEQLKAIKKDTALYLNMFIQSGFEALRAMGFEVREKEAAPATPTP